MKSFQNFRSFVEVLKHSKNELFWWNSKYRCIPTTYRLLETQYWWHQMNNKLHYFGTSYYILSNQIGMCGSTYTSGFVKRLHFLAFQDQDKVCWIFETVSPSSHKVITNYRKTWFLLYRTRISGVRPYEILCTFGYKTTGFKAYTVPFPRISYVVANVVS